MTLSDLKLSEGWVRHQLAANPSLLGLNGTFIPVQERVQHGRLDLLLKSDQENAIVIVEIQRGSVDVSHITRLLEYAAFEQRMAPSFLCRPFLVAESFSGKAGRLALALSRLKAVELYSVDAHTVNGAPSLTAKACNAPVLTARPSPVGNWEAKWTSRPWFALAKVLLAPIREIDDESSFKFNKSFIGVQKNGGTFNSMAIKSVSDDFFHLELKLESDERHLNLISAIGLSAIYKDASDYNRHYLVTIPADFCPKQIAKLQPLVAMAHSRWTHKSTRQA